MPIPNKLRTKAKQENTTVLEIISTAIEKHGSVNAAAISLGVEDYSLTSWLDRHGYEVIRRRVAKVVKSDGSKVDNVSKSAVVYPGTVPNPKLASLTKPASAADDDVRYEPIDEV